MNEMNKMDPAPRIRLRRFNATLLTVLIALSVAAPLKAQSTGAITFERLSTEQGLSNYTIRSILQDRSGFLWFGTGGGGLNRYDGYTFKVYAQDQADPADDYIDALYEDHLGMLWIGTQDGGIYVFDPKTEQFTDYAPDPEDPGSLSYHNVQAIYEDQEKAVWIGTLGGGLNRFDRATERFTRFRSDPGDPYSLASDSVLAIYEAPSEPGVLWVGTERGLHRLELSTERFARYTPDPRGAQNLMHDAVGAIYAEKSGVFWVGTHNSGLYTFHPGSGTFKHYVHDASDPQSLSSNYVHTIYEDRYGVLWIGTLGGGLNRFDRATERFTRYENAADNSGSLPDNQVHAILMDRAGVLWVGTWGGLGKHIPFHERYSPVRERYTHVPNNPNSLSHQKVVSIYEDRSGMLWIGTLGGGLNKLDRRTNRVTRIPLAFRDVIAICEDQSGALWLGTRDNNLYHFDRETAQVRAYPLHDAGDRHPEDIVLTIYEAPSEPGVLWIGTKLDGLYAFHVQSRRVIGAFAYDPARASGLSHNYAWPIYEDHSGMLWIGTIGGGLNKFDRETETFTHYKHDNSDPNSISSDDIFSVHEDEEGTLWIGTRGGGLNKFDRTIGRFVRYTMRNGLPDNDILGILSDRAGHLWISTNNGISRFNPQKEVFINYGVADGLQGTIFSAGATFMNARGELFFGGQEGFNVLIPNSAEDDLPIPPVVLTDFQLFGESEPLDSSITAIREIRRSYNENFITFEFAALDFTDPSKNQYQYKLEAVDKEWFMAGDQRYARYPDLAPGEYTFRVIGSNKNNIWNEEGVSVRVAISPPPWQTYEAYILYFIALVSVIFSGYKWRVRSLRARAEELARLVEERTRDLEAEKKTTEEQAERLRELEQVKDRFFENISHEFRTPLQLIHSPIEDALRGSYGTLSERLQQRLTVMHHHSNYLKTLIEKLLNLAKVQSGGMTLCAQQGNAVSFVEETVQPFYAQAERERVELQFYSELEDAPLYFEAEKLTMVITNLLSNALKFTPEHGKVRVSVRTIEEGDKAFVEISVKDTGKGIPPDELSKIFDRFYQVEKSMTRGHEGTGIGLALAKDLVELHGGTIEVESELDFGTTFFVRLRQGKDHLGPDAIKEPTESTPGAHTSEGVQHVTFTPEEPSLPGEPVSEAPEDAPTILVVEDNADVRDYVKEHLAELYRVVEAVDGEEGLAKAQEDPPDLIISDVMMPKMDGYALCRAIKTDEELNHIPVILLTAKASQKDEIEGLQIGADDYICKPFSAEVLRLRVGNHIGIRWLLRQRYSREVILKPRGTAVSSVDADFAQQVQEVVDTNLHHSNFGVDWLANEVALSRRQLQRRMGEILDVTPSVFIQTMRLQRATQLLEQQAGTIKEIAYQVGYRDPNYFSRLFKEHIGVSPVNYMKDQT